MTDSKQPMSWTLIVAICLVTGLVAGLTLGALGELVNLGGGARTAGVGVTIGLVAAVLVQRRRAALSALR